MDWRKVVFLHTGWADRYDGTEAPIGGHEYLRSAVGVEAENFKPIDGWCYGYAPVARTGRYRGIKPIPKGGRTLNISKLGAPMHHDEVDGITVVWTATRPGHGPVIVGLYDNATAYRFMPPDAGDERIFIAKARAEDCRQLPKVQRTFAVIRSRKGFPGMGAAWFPGEHHEGPAREFLAEVADYLPVVRKFNPVSADSSS
jgi:hypothetical protein